LEQVDSVRANRSEFWAVEDLGVELSKWVKKLDLQIIASTKPEKNKTMGWRKGTEGAARE
jgi:hypothetical protein